MKSNSFSYGRTKTVDIEKKNDNKVFIKIPLEKGGFWQKEYYQNDLIESVVKDFKAENHVEIPQNYFMDWNFKNKSLKMTDTIKTLLNQEIPTVCINQVIKKKPLQINNDEIIPDLVGKPFNEPFEVFLFAKDDKSLKIQTYDPITVNNLYLNNYSPSSAYCNGNNHLFISGGEKKNGEIIDNFWEIDLKDQNIAEPVKIPPKKNHSMIFIPNNYVFIVGGNDKKTFYFNTENAEVCEWANLNVIRTEPALQRISNYLYCFDNISKGNNDSFTLEKTDLKSNSPEWVLYTPKLNFQDVNVEKLNQKFFGVSKDDENNIIFLGGNMDNYNNNNELFNYKYNTFLNTIEVSKVPYRKYNFKEKTFLSYKNNIDYILPDFNKQHPEVVFFVKNKNKIEAIDYEPKLNAQIRPLKYQTSDHKYDFNMPTVAIPDPIIDYNFDQQNIEITTDQPKMINSNIKMNVHDPSFQDNNFKNQIEKINDNNNIELQTNFKEPEIEPTKQDLKLSLDIQESITKNDKMANLRSKGNNSNIKINDSYQFNNVRDPNYQNAHYYTNMPSQQTDIYIPKFHASVNPSYSHINENNNSKYNINGKIETNDINVNIQKKEIDPIKGNKAYDSSLSGVISGTGVPLNGTNNKIDIKKEVDIKGTIHGTKSNNNKNNQKKNNENYSISGIIPGIKEKDQKIGLKGPNINNTNIGLKGPKINTSNINIEEENNKSINLNGPKTEINSSNINIVNQKHEISGIIPSDNNNNRKVEMSMSRISNNKSKIPDFNLNGNIPGKKLNSSNSKINLKNKSNNNINSSASNIKINESNLNISPEKNEKKINSLEYNDSGIIQGNNNIINSTKNNMKKDYNIEGTIKGKKQNNQKTNNNLNNNNTNVKLKNQNLNIDDIPKGQRKMKSKPKKKEEVFYSGIIPGIKKNIEIPSGNIDLKDPKVDIPNINLTENIIKANEPTVDLNINNNFKDEKKTVNIPGYDINGKIPDVNLNEPKIDIKGTNYNINGDIPGINLNKPTIEKKVLNIDNNLDGLKIETNNPNNNNITELKVNLPETDPNPPKIDLGSYNIKESNIKKEVNIPKIEIPDGNKNITLNQIINPNYNEEGINKEVEINNPNINANNPNASINLMEKSIKEINLTGTIVGSKINEPYINNNKSIQQLQNSNYYLLSQNKSQNTDINNRNINLPSSQLQINDNINIKENIHNLSTNPQITEVKKYNNTYVNYDINGNIPGIKNPNSNININKPEQYAFNLTGIIPSSKTNKKQNINYKINNPDVQLFDNTNNPIRVINTHKNFHGNINDLNFTEIKELKGSRNPFYYSNINNNNNINNQIILNAPPKNNSKNVNLVVKKMEILPQENINISNNNTHTINNSQNIIEKSNIEFFPSQIEYNNIPISYSINNNINNINPQINNIGYTDEYIINNNDDKNNNIINNEDIHIEMPKVDMKINSNEIIEEAAKLKMQNKSNNNNNIKKSNNHVLTDLRFKAIEEEDNKNILGDENIYSGNRNGSNRANSRRKNNDLPLVGMKNNEFKSSKVGVVGKLNTENIDVNNIKSSNVGVNGIKIGDRIIE